MKPTPFEEKNSRLRGALDLATGCYPRFLFGGRVGDAIPVFHFHEAHPAALEPYFRYLAENNYRTVDSAAISTFVHKGIHPGPGSVAICFDDAWADLWIVVAPLLAKYTLRAITYVSPARVPSLPELRTQWDGRSAFDRVAIDRSDVPFATWSELRALHESGLVDIQAHSWRHAKIFSGSEVCDFLSPGERRHPHHYPLIDERGGQRLATPGDLGAPLYPVRSRLSDARRWIAPDAFEACTGLVHTEGGEQFFERPNWRRALAKCAADAPPGHWEDDAEQEANVLEELVRAREVLSAQLRSHTVKHMCFPWAIAGQKAARLAKVAGYETAFGDRMWGARIVRSGDPPYQLMRLKHPLIFCLPGKGRTWFFGRKAASASRGLQLG